MIPSFLKILRQFDRQRLTMASHSPFPSSLGESLDSLRLKMRHDEIPVRRPPKAGGDQDKQKEKDIPFFQLTAPRSIA